MFVPRPFCYLCACPAMPLHISASCLDVVRIYHCHHIEEVIRQLGLLSDATPKSQYSRCLRYSVSAKPAYYGLAKMPALPIFAVQTFPSSESHNKAWTL
ncbi:hypothetical protein LY76DRAFT_83376 [Colletotrichum caudatum]|nr:hypothetical protein LY76DRAFT_83376 [Colletotrichum caudatum]